MFQAIYDSGWAHPFVAWVGTLALAVVLLRQKRRDFLGKYLVLFGVEIFLDALCTGAWSPVPPAITSSVGIAFVILGDWRLFVLTERFTKPDKWLARSIALAFVVPVAQAVMIKLFPEQFAEPRKIYLAYEVCFVLFGSFMRFHVWPKRGADPWILSLGTWFLIQYALWATSDVIILSGGEWGLLLRLVPNAMYYAGFLLFCSLRAPQQLR